MERFGIRRIIGFFLGPLLFATILLLPRPAGLSPEGQAVSAIAVLMATWWVSEAIPIPATALLPFALMPLLGVMDYGLVAPSYAHPLIFLFLGGFLIARTMERWGLHRRLALVTILLIGASPVRMVLGFMVASALLSMWISNTATAMMMVPIGLAVTSRILPESTAGGPRPGSSRFGAALMLGIAYACSIGGVATLIGTPPNMILAGIVERLYGQNIGFVKWLSFGLPLSVVMLLLTWLLLTRVIFPPEFDEFPGGRKVIRLELEGLGPMGREERSVAAVFLLVALAWLGRGLIDLPGLAMIHDSTIAICGALLLFVIPADFNKGGFLLDWKTAVTVPWDIMLLFGGGLALAKGVADAGLATWIAGRLSVLEGLNLLLLVFCVALLTTFLTEVSSNTATATVLVPVTGSLALALGVHPYALIVAAGVAASYAFMLPVATPPNAVVFGSRRVDIRQMARAGLVLNLVGALMITAAVYLLLPLVWGIELGTLPQWTMP